MWPQDFMPKRPLYTVHKRMYYLTPSLFMGRDGSSSILNPLRVLVPMEERSFYKVVTKSLLGNLIIREGGSRTEFEHR